MFKKYVLHKLSYLHKPLSFNDCMIMVLLCSVVEYDSLPMSIIICLICSNVVTIDVMLSLCECVLFMFVDLCLLVYVWYAGLHLDLVLGLVYCHGVIGGFICASITYHGLCLGPGLT